MTKYKWMIPLIGIWLCVQTTACGSSRGELLLASEQTELETQDNSTQTAEADTDTSEVKTADARAGVTEDDTEICVYVCGQVRMPGVYRLTGAPRVCDAVEAAGGFSADAGQEYWNLAAIVEDGAMIYIPTKDEAAMYQEAGFENFGGQQASQGFTGLAGSEQKTEDADGKVNLNSADLVMLMTLPGIGESKAQSIIDYREQNGRFSSIEDVMNVDGIKNGLFQKIKEKITV